MKTRDLMRGDKVYETLVEDTPQVVTVEEVGQNHIYIGMEDDDMALLRYEPEHLGWNIKHIEPIPLTKEILMTNGFRCVNENSAYTLMVMSDDGYTIEVYICIANCVFNVEHNYTLNKERAMDRTHKCGYYVHQLQHALRICGLNDLADNFKIE